MKTKHNILSLALAAALVGTLALPTPKAQADDRTAAFTILGVLVGGTLGYIIGESDDHRDRRCVETVIPAPAPVVVYQPQPVIVTRPVVYQPQPVIVTRPVVVRPTNPHRERPGNRYGHDRDRRPEPGNGRRDDRDEGRGNGERDHGRR